MKQKMIALVLAMTCALTACAQTADTDNTRKKNNKKRNEPTTTTTTVPDADLIGNPDLDHPTKRGLLFSQDAKRHYITDIHSYCSVIDWVEYSPAVAGSELTVQPIIDMDGPADQTIKMYVFAYNDDYAWNFEDAYAEFEGTRCNNVYIGDGQGSIYWISDNLPKDMKSGRYTLVFVHNDGTVDAMMDIDLVSSPEEAKAHYEVDKPVIYLYPEQETEVYVNLELQGCLSCTYPKYDDAFGWHVLAHEDGTLYNYSDGRNYDYLFWEGITDVDLAVFDQAVCVKGEDTAKFLEEYLTAAGLNDSEIDDFISFWLPKMQNNPYNLISFPTKEYTEMAKLNVYPAPDTEIRVFMVFRGLTEAVDIPAENALPMPSGVVRRGFTVVEWGGTEA